MSKYKPSDNSAQATLDEQQRRSSLIAEWLQKMALPSVFNRELTEQDYEAWEHILASYPLKGIEYAFENWIRNGSGWPKPSSILELIGAWALSKKSDQRPRYENHGEGYGEADVLALWKLFREKYAKPLDRPLTDQERADLIDELDRRRKAVA